MAGKRFFNYALHYGKQLEQIQKLINKVHTDKQIPSSGSGDLYIKQLHKCALLFLQIALVLKTYLKG